MICKIKDALYNFCDKNVIIWSTHVNALFALYNKNNSKVTANDISHLLLSFLYLRVKSFS